MAQDESWSLQDIFQLIFDPDLIFGMKDNPIAAGDIKYSFFETLEDGSKF